MESPILEYKYCTLPVQYRYSTSLIHSYNKYCMSRTNILVWPRSNINQQQQQQQSVGRTEHSLLYGAEYSSTVRTVLLAVATQYSVRALDIARG